jgi:hypothetical protein
MLLGQLHGDHRVSNTLQMDLVLRVLVNRQMSIGLGKRSLASLFH